MFEQSSKIDKLTDIVISQNKMIRKLQKCQHYKCKLCGEVNEVEVSESETES